MRGRAIRANGTYDKLFDRSRMTELKGPTFTIRGDGPPTDGWS
jgi:polar amino acid transport system substrate-binding protein